MGLGGAHWRPSTMVAWAIGIRDRGWLREGMPADIVVYDLEKLRVKEMETVHDLPDGDCRRVQKAEGYHAVIVNGQITFEDNVCTNALPGKLLRSYDQVPGGSTRRFEILLQRGRPATGAASCRMHGLVIAIMAHLLHE